MRHVLRFAALLVSCAVKLSSTGPPPRCFDQRAFVLSGPLWQFAACRRTAHDGLGAGCRTRMLPAPTISEGGCWRGVVAVSAGRSPANKAAGARGGSPAKNTTARAKASKKQQAPATVRSAEDDATVQAPDVLSKGLGTTKSDAMTDEALREEFAVKALMLLREAGGGLESTKFLRRWKCTFPSDDIKRYMRGRRLSVARLLETCGGTFAVHDVEGSRIKKLYTIAQGADGVAAGRTLPTDARVLMELQDVLPEGHGGRASEAPLLRAAQVQNLELNWTAATLPLTLDDEGHVSPPRMPPVDDGGSRGKEEDGEAMEVRSNDSSSRQESAPGASAHLDSEDGFVAIPSSSIPRSSSSPLFSLIDAGTPTTLQYSVLPEEEEDGEGGEWRYDLEEEDGKILDARQRDGACSELCCELPVGDAVCAQNVESGLELLRSFKKMGITFGNVLSYNALLDMCALAANQHTTNFANYALSVLETMRENRVRPNAETYSALLRSCCQSREGLFKAVGVLQEMREAGLEPPRHDYLLLLDACLKEAQRGNGIAAEQGLAVLETMCQAHVLPDVNRCLAMISVIPHDGAWCNFCRDKVVELMQESGVVDEDELTAAMRLACQLNSKD